MSVHLLARIAPRTVFDAAQDRPADAPHAVACRLGHESLSRVDAACRPYDRSLPDV